MSFFNVCGQEAEYTENCDVCGCPACARDQHCCLEPESKDLVSVCSVCFVVLKDSGWSFLRIQDLQEREEALINVLTEKSDFFLLHTDNPDNFYLTRDRLECERLSEVVRNDPLYNDHPYYCSHCKSTVGWDDMATCNGCDGWVCAAKCGRDVLGEQESNDKYDRVLVLFLCNACLEEAEQQQTTTTTRRREGTVSKY